MEPVSETQQPEDEQLECDQIVSSSDSTEETAKLSFIERSSSLPMVSEALNFMTSTYNTLKDKNQTLGTVMDGVEMSVSRATTVAVGISKKVVNPDFLDSLACKGLDKVESVLPQIKKPSKEIMQDTRDYALTKLSGVSDPNEIPKTVSEALSKRRLYLESRLSSMVWDNRIGQSVLGISNKALDFTENAVEVLLPPKEGSSNKERKSEERIVTRMLGIGGTARKRFVALARELSNDRDQGSERITVTDMASVTNHWLSNLYKRLQEKPTNESLLMKSLRYSALTTVGATLTVSGAAAATIPRLEEFVSAAAARGRRTVNTVITPVKTAADRAVAPARSAYNALWTKYAEGVNYAKQTYSRLSSEAVTYVKDLPEKVKQKLPDPLQRNVDRGLDFLKKLNTYIRDSWNTRYLKASEDGVGPVPTPEVDGEATTTKE